MFLILSVNLHSQPAEQDNIRNLIMQSGGLQQTTEILKAQYDQLVYNNQFGIGYNEVSRYFWYGLDNGMILDTLVSLYGKIYTREEIKELINFFDTPAGKKLSQKRSDLNRIMTRQMAEYINDTITKIKRNINQNKKISRLHADSLDNYLWNFKFHSARAALNKAIEIYPFEYKYYRDRAHINKLLRDYEALIKDLTTIIGFNNENSEHFNSLLIRANIYYNMGRYKDFVDDKYKLLKLKNLSYNLDKLGNKLHVNDLIAKLSEAIEYEPSYALSYYSRASIKIISSRNEYETDYEDIISDLDKAIELDPELSDAYAVRLQCYNRTGDFKAVIEDCDNLIKINPWIQQIYLYRARAQMYLNNFREAISNCRSASQAPDNFMDYYIRIDPDLPKDIYNRDMINLIKGWSHLKAGDEKIIKEKYMNYSGSGGIANYLFMGDIAINFGDIEEALDHYFNAMLSLNIYKAEYNDAFGYLKKISKDLKMSFSTDILNKIDQAKKSGIDPAKTGFVKAHIYFFLKDTEKAIEELNRVIIQSPEFEEAIYLRALANIQKKNYKEAMEDYEKLAKAIPDPDSAKQAKYTKAMDLSSLYCSMALLMEKTGDIDKTVEYFNTALHYWSVPRKQFEHYLDILHDRGEYVQMFEAYNEYTRHGISLHDLHNIAKIKLKTGDPSAALKIYFNTWKPEILIFNNKIRLQKDHFYLNYDIRPELEEIMQAIPDSRVAYFLLGLMTLRLNDEHEAEDVFEDMIETFPSYPEGYFGKALILSENEYYKKALKNFDKALLLDPEFALGYFCRGECLSKMGDRTGACNDFNEFRNRYLVSGKQYMFLGGHKFLKSDRWDDKPYFFLKNDDCNIKPIEEPEIEY